MIITCAEEICALLKQERADRGQSQREFAAVVGYDQQRVSTYERAPKGMPLRTALRMLRRLGYHVEVTKTAQRRVA